MIRRPPTPEELWQKCLDPFEEDEESPEEFALRCDREMERTLAMTPAEIRADLTAMGYDVKALEREAREFLGRMGWRTPRRGHGRLYAIGAPIALLAMLAEAAAPVAEAVPQYIPAVAAAAPSEAPATTTAAPLTTDSPEEDGGSDDARAR